MQDKAHENLLIKLKLIKFNYNRRLWKLNYYKGSHFVSFIGK